MEILLDCRRASVSEQGQPTALGGETLPGSGNGSSSHGIQRQSWSLAPLPEPSDPRCFPCCHRNNTKPSLVLSPPLARLWGQLGKWQLPAAPGSPGTLWMDFPLVFPHTNHRTPALLPPGALPCPAVYGGISQPCLGTCLRLHYSYLLLGLGSPSQAEPVLYVPGIGVSSASPLQSVPRSCRVGDTRPANCILM